MRNDRGAFTPERRNQANHLCGNSCPDGQRPAGLLANLQVARATKSLIERNDNHNDILGEISREIKLPEVARAVLSLTLLRISST